MNCEINFIYLFTFHNQALNVKPIDRVAVAILLNLILVNVFKVHNFQVSKLSRSEI